MTGAATLAAEAALRSGAGLVTLLVPESLNDIMEVKVTEAMTIPVPEGKARAFGMASLDKVLEYVAKWDGAVIGPGFGRDEDTVAFTQELIRRIDKPAVVDADALYAISRDLSVLKECKGKARAHPASRRDGDAVRNHDGGCAVKQVGGRAQVCTRLWGNTYTKGRADNHSRARRKRIYQHNWDTRHGDRRHWGCADRPAWAD